MNQTLIDKPKNKWLQPGFLIVVVLLALSAAGLNSAVALMKLHFIKAPVPIGRELTTVPAQLGDWVQVSLDEPLDKGKQELLGTEKYIFRNYINMKAMDWADLVKAGDSQTGDSPMGHPRSVTEEIHSLFDGKPSRMRDNIFAKLQQVKPEAAMSLAITYYTGQVDTVAHIPERCYVADGYQPTDTPETLTWNMGPGRQGGASDGNIAVRSVNFSDVTNQGRITKRVAYFFFCDGVYESDPLSVRQRLENLRSHHGFYSKVELMTIIPDHDESARMMNGFLVTAMPEIEKCWPDWNSVEHPGEHLAAK